MWDCARVRVAGGPAPTVREDRHASARQVPAFVPTGLLGRPAGEPLCAERRMHPRCWRAEGRKRRDHSRAYKKRTSARQLAGSGYPARASQTGRIAGLSSPPAPSGILRSRPQITLVKRGSWLRIPPSAWLPSTVFWRSSPVASPARAYKRVQSDRGAVRGPARLRSRPGCARWVELLEGMCVRAQAFLGGVARLARNLHDRDAPVDQERHERVAKVVGATGLQAGGEGGGSVDPLAPVA